MKEYQRKTRIRFSTWSLAWGLVAIFPNTSYSEDSTLSLPQLPEIIEVIREHLPVISQEDLDRAALQGILTEFQSQLEIVPTRSDSEAESETQITALTRYYESSIAYLASPMIDGKALAAIQQGYARLESENILQGLLLDLRHVAGSDYSELTKITGLLTDQSIPLLNWGEGIKNSQPQPTLIKTPIVALIDETTQGAGEALAAVIRSAKLGILVGRQTAGVVHSYDEIPLKTGQTLKLATGTIILASGQSLDSTGVRPDIIVHKSNSVPREETEESTNEVQSTDSPLSIPNDDPILARGFELIKGINIVEGRNRS